MNCKNCNKLSCMDCVAELEKQIGQKNADLMLLTRCLESFTPGGSEFHDDPGRCILWIKDRINSVVEQAKKRKETEAENAALKADNQCTECFGTGMEICSNPDHGIVDSLSFHDIGRIGCPLCGHDELYRIPNTTCGACGGSGKRTDELEGENAALLQELAQCKKAIRLISESMHDAIDGECALCPITKSGQNCKAVTNGDCYSLIADYFLQQTQN